MTYKGNPAAEGEAAARADNRRALEELNQDEAAELAETIEAERKGAILKLSGNMKEIDISRPNAHLVSDEELADELTDLSIDELLTLWSMTGEDLSTMHDRLDSNLDASAELYKERLSVYRRLELRIEFLQNHKET